MHMNLSARKIYKKNNFSKVFVVAFLLMSFPQSKAFAAAYKDSVKTIPVKKDTTDENNKVEESLIPKETINASYTTGLNPKAASFVQQYAQKESKEYEKMKIWGKPYFDLYDKILTEYGIPKEMKYLSVIESSLQPGTISWAGAVGPWQLMGDEGKRFGLRMNGAIDERMDFYKSTHAAAKLMKELYSEFGDWLLVIAAYNGGVGRVKQCIRKANSKDFWDLQYFLPEETRNHVKKFIGTHFIFEGSGGLTTMTAIEVGKYKAQMGNASAIQLTDEEIKTTSIVEIKGRYLSAVVSSSLMMDIEQFNKWNPGFDKALAEGKNYAVRLTKDRAAIFEAKKSQILLESIRTLLNG